MSTTRLAINGFGRIGRSIFRALHQSEHAEHGALEVVAINELADIDTISYMLRHDSTHGRFAGRVEAKGDTLWVNDKPIEVSHFQSPQTCPWLTHRVDVVLECSGCINRAADANAHLHAGAKRVLLANPADDDVDQTVIFGWNQDRLASSDTIVANGSCSTNALIPLLDFIDKALGVEAGVTTTVHSAMNDQPVIDAYNHDLRRTRSAAVSMIPVDTGLHLGVARLMPHLRDRMQSLHVRVPTINVSALDISLQLKQHTDLEAVNRLLADFAQQHSAQVGITFEPQASIDFNGDAHSAVIDATQTRLAGATLLKLWVWFDNEWGFANRMLDTAAYWSRLHQ